MPDSYPITPEKRDEVIRKINEVLIKGKYDTGKKYGIPTRPPEVFSFQNPNGDDFKDDPQGMAALSEFAKQYPDTFNRAGVVNMGQTNLTYAGKPAYGLTWSNRYARNEPMVSIANSDQLKNTNSTTSFSGAMDVLRHEFGHVMGLNDNPTLGKLHHQDVPSTYNLQNWSNLLDRDIELPKETSIAPTRKIKVR